MFFSEAENTSAEGIVFKVLCCSESISHSVCSYPSTLFLDISGVSLDLYVGTVWLLEIKADSFMNYVQIRVCDINGICLSCSLKPQSDSGPNIIIIMNMVPHLTRPVFDTIFSGDSESVKLFIETCHLTNYRQVLLIVMRYPFFMSIQLGLITLCMISYGHGCACAGE